MRRHQVNQESENKTDEENENASFQIGKAKVLLDCEHGITIWDEQATNYVSLVRFAEDAARVLRPSNLMQFWESLLRFELEYREFPVELKGNLPMYNQDADILWDYLRLKYNVDSEREMEILTFGTRFLDDNHFLKADVEKWMKTCTHRFYATDLHSPRSQQLLKLKGDDSRLQASIRGSEEFISLLDLIVEQVEQEPKLEKREKRGKKREKLAIICHSGHHRSVAVAEMLKQNLYPSALCHHMTINCSSAETSWNQYHFQYHLSQ